MSLTFNDVKTFITAGLAAKNYSTTNPITSKESVRSLPLFLPGPASASQLQQLDPGPIVFLQVGGGAGYDIEQLADGIFINVRVIGQQANYEFAETLALDIDLLISALAGNGMIGTTKVLFATRTGGAPQLIDYDNADRYHFQCTYIAKTLTTGLVT